MPHSPPARSIPFDSGIPLRIIAANRSTHYARHWLRLLGCRSTGAGQGVTIIAGDTAMPAPAAGAVIRLWDFQVGMPGTGVLASAVSGAAAVIGRPGHAAVPLPADMPEKWCGAYGVILALAEIWRRRHDSAMPLVVHDVGAADILRSFALQNAGDRAETVRRWRRNGRVCVEHGGIFPMGFYGCRDGHVALLGRSRRDWRNIRAAIDDPEWARTPACDDPFALALDSRAADARLEQSLAAFGRDELLARGLATGAVIAPVFSQDEANARGIFRPDFIKQGQPGLPFLARPAPGAADAAPTTEAAPRLRTADAPLSGLRCLELCWVWSGPMTTQILADLGAEVIKIETPDRFDLYRTRGLETARGSMPEKLRIESSPYFHSLNRNKLGLSLDLKTPSGLETMQRLAARSALLVENFTVGVVERLGLGSDSLQRINPALVHLSMSGPGRGSSVAALRSYGLVLSALGGAEATIVDAGGFLGSPTFSVSDPNAAVFGAMAAMAGILSARSSGCGTAIDLSQIEAAATLAGTAQTLRTTRDVIVAAAGGDHLAISVPAAVHADDAAMRTDFCGRTADAITGRCRALGGQAVRLVNLEDTDSAPAFAACTGHIVSCHPCTGDELLVAAPWRVDGRRPAARKPAPLLGESNDYVLRGILGLDAPDAAACGSGAGKAAS